MDYEHSVRRGIVWDIELIKQVLVHYICYFKSPISLIRERAQVLHISD